MVYFILDSVSQCFKIGYASDPYKRIQGLQTGNPNRLEILGSIPGSMEKEKEAQRAFSSFRCSPSGEWFRATGESLALVRLLLDAGSKHPRSSDFISFSHALPVLVCPSCQCEFVIWDKTRSLTKDDDDGSAWWMVQCVLCFRCERGCHFEIKICRNDLAPEDCPRPMVPLGSTYLATETLDP